MDFKIYQKSYHISCIKIRTYEKHFEAGELFFVPISSTVPHYLRHHSQIFFSTSELLEWYLRCFILHSFWTLYLHLMSQNNAHKRKHPFRGVFFPYYFWNEASWVAFFSDHDQESKYLIRASSRLHTRIHDRPLYQRKAQHTYLVKQPHH